MRHSAAARLICLRKPFDLDRKPARRLQSTVRRHRQSSNLTDFIPFPSISDVHQFLNGVVLLALSVGAGAFLRRGGSIRGADVIVGYGAISAAIIVLGLLKVPLRVAAAIVIVAALLAGVRAVSSWREQKPLMRCLLPMVPVLLILSAIPPLEWDDLAHWVPNAAYLYQYNAFPSAGVSGSQWTRLGYPYAMPLWTWLVSLASGGFVENAGVLASGFFLAAAAALFIEAGQTEAGRTPGPAASWGAAGLAVLAVTVLSPTFKSAYTLTGYADTATSVAVAAFAWISCRALHDLDRQPLRGNSAAFIQLAFCALLLVDLKQSNLILLALLGCGFGLAALSMRKWRAAGPVVAVAAATIPACVLWFCWDRYVSTQVPSGSFTWMPADEWAWDKAAQILHAMLIEGGLKLNVILAVVILLAVRALARGPRNTADLLSIVTAVVACGYTAFLFVAYVGAFAEYEAVRAASFFRYLSHVGILAVLCLLCQAVPYLFNRGSSRAMQMPPSRAATAGALIFAVAVGAVLSFRWNHLVAAGYLPAQKAGAIIAEAMPAKSTVAIVTPRDVGVVAHAVRYQLYRFGRDDRAIQVRQTVTSATPDPLSEARAIAADAAIRNVILLDATDEIAALFQSPAGGRGLQWMSREDGVWRVHRIVPLDRR